MNAPRLFTVPPDVGFLPALARAILAGGFPHPEAPPPDPLSLAHWTIFLPTRRSLRALQLAFLGAGTANACLLPRVRALADVDEEDLLFGDGDGQDALADLPAAVAPLERLFILTRLLADWAESNRTSRIAKSLMASPSQALMLARSLAQLIDSLEIEEVDPGNLAKLPDEELAGHHAELLDLLAIVKGRYPHALKERDRIGAATRRAVIMDAEAERLTRSPSPAPVIAAGSTGSIPATARLLAAIANAPQGAVVLPGLDLDLDDASWKALDAQHPQFGLRELLAKLGATRDDVRLLPGIEQSSAGRGRNRLLSLALLPSATSDAWRDAVAAEPAMLARATAGLSVIEAPDRREEAAAIALILRRTLETPGRTAALVTPDRRLARRVKTELGRYGIAIDDSAGKPLSRSPEGTVVSLLAEGALEGLSPRSLVALLDHPLATFGMDRSIVMQGGRALSLAVLRAEPSRGVDGLAERVARRRGTISDERHLHPRVRHLGTAAWNDARRLAQMLEMGLSDLARTFADPSPKPLAALVKVHIAAVEAATRAADGKDATLWRGDAGEALARTFAELLDHAAEAPLLTPNDYVGFLAWLLDSVPLRQPPLGHPRLQILGLLEARMVRADVMVLGGLNDGIWPAVVDTDPWLNRPQRRALGLPLPERRIGLSAHDFAQAAAAPEIYLTLSKKVDGEPRVHSRFLLRLLTLLKMAGKEKRVTGGDPWVGWALGLDRPPGEPKPISTPAPMPPLEARPARLSVTQVEKLLDDPYAIYARHVLRLQPLDPLEAEIGAGERGQVVHAILHRFIEGHPDVLPMDAEARFLAIAREVLETEIDDAAARAFWWPQIERMARWFLEQERMWRSDLAASHVEQDAQHAFPLGASAFTLTARADRVDRLRSGGLRIVDYKTGSLPSRADVVTGKRPQLPLEAWLAMQGAFKGIPAASVRQLTYVRLTGGDPAGETLDLDLDAEGTANQAFEGLCQLLTDYADLAQPYRPRGWQERDQRQIEGDYDHLSRWREWGHLGNRNGSP